MNYVEERPWGKFEVLYDGEDCKVKRITVDTNGELSLQYHKHRKELWQCISGVGNVTIGSKTFNFLPGDIVEIEREERHQIKNYRAKPCVFIEVQTGTSFEEDDIVRLTDKYGRV